MPRWSPSEAFGGANARVTGRINRDANRKANRGGDGGPSREANGGTRHKRPLWPTYKRSSTKASTTKKPPSYNMIFDPPSSHNQVKNKLYGRRCLKHECPI